MFMLLLLLIVKGWTITRARLSLLSKLVLLTVWLAYTAANVALFIWNQVLATDLHQVRRREP